MENMMLTAKILWRNGPSGVLLKCAEILGECQILGYGKVNLSVCCCFGARPLKFRINSNTASITTRAPYNVCCSYS